MTGRRSHGRLSALNGVVHQGKEEPQRGDGEAYPEQDQQADDDGAGGKENEIEIRRYDDFGDEDDRSENYPAPVPTENLIRTVRVTDRADVGPANDGNVSIAAVHSVNVDEWLASFGRSSGRRAACTVFRRRPSMAVVRPRDDGSCGAGRPRAASP